MNEAAKDKPATDSVSRGLRLRAAVGRFLAIAITLVACAAAAFIGWHAWLAYATTPWTRDGAVRAYTISVASEVADPAGKPWSDVKKMVWWDEEAGEWTGTDVPDFEPTKRPDYRPDWSKQPKGMDALGGADPFIMEADGHCMIFVPSGLKDGPLPTHYEPLESPVLNALHPGRQVNPAAKIWQRPGNELHGAADPRYPYIFSTYRLAELHCGGIPTRIMPHTAELQPEAFVEVSPELARELGITHLGWTTLSSLRGEIEVKRSSPSGFGRS